MKPFFGGSSEGHWAYVEAAKRSLNIHSAMGIREPALPGVLPTAPGNFVASGNVQPKHQTQAGLAAEPRKRRARGGGTTDPSIPVGAVNSGTLPPPAPSALTDQHAGALPTVAQASNAPELLGEQGGQSMANPRITTNMALVQALSPPQSVSPSAVELPLPQNNPNAAAISTQHTPDQGAEAIQLAKARQLPSSNAYVATEQSINLQNDAIPAPGRGGGGRRRSIFKAK